MSPIVQNDFIWRDHVAIDPRFSPQERLILEKSIDSIANLSDGEGRALIAGAAQRAGGTLSIVRSSEGTTATPDNTLQLDFKQAAQLFYVQPDGARAHPSLTGIVVHELFHLNDYSADFSLEMPRLRSALAAQMEKLPHDVVSRFSGELNYIDVRFLEEVMSDNGLNNKQIATALRKTGFENIASFIEQNGTTIFRQALEESGIFDRTDKIRTEESAVRFTDQFMQKHFGDIEPRRGIYRNAGFDPNIKDALLTVPPPLAHMAPVSGFTENYDVPVPLGSPSLPTVTPTNQILQSSANVPLFGNLLKDVTLSLKQVKCAPDGANLNERCPNVITPAAKSNPRQEEPSPIR